MNVRPYQRRRRGPVTVIVSVLTVIAVTTWTVVLLGAGAGAGGTTCPPAPAGVAIGEILASDALDGVAPAAASEVGVRVLNAGGQRGQANLVAAQLGELGFAQAAAPGNDTVFPDGGMACVGQIRFGPAGEAGASTVALVLPCAQLVRDGRTDPVVDVGVGTEFGDVNPTKAARDALNRLAAPAAPSDPDAGAAGAAAVPTVDPTTLGSARTRTC